MRKSLKRYFIPHAGNNFHPHFFRSAAVLSIILVLSLSQLLLLSAFKTLSRNDSFAAIFVGALLSYTNEARAAGIGQWLVTNPLLTEAAQLKANDMAEKGYFSHNTPEGKSPWYWFNRVGYAYQYAGENLAIDFVDSKDVTNAWMSSPGHRANILNSNYKEIGVATAVGTYQGRETTFVVQMFGTPQPLPTKLPAHGEVQNSQPISSASVMRALVSPKETVANLYLLFIAFVTGLMLFGALYEFKRHHKGIWLSGSLLILVAGILIAATLQFGEGIVFFWF